jgi:tetratricopeptide (TPR) repeat protein
LNHPPNLPPPHIIFPSNSPSQETPVSTRVKKTVPFENLFKSTLEPSMYNGHYNLGVNHFKQKEYYLAMSEFEKAFEKDNKPIYLANTAICFKKIGALNEALENIKKVVNLEPLGEYHRFAGHLLFGLAKTSGEYNKIVGALDNFKDAYELNKVYGNKFNYLQLRKILYFKKLDQSEEDYAELFDYLFNENSSPTSHSSEGFKKEHEIIKTGRSHLKKVGKSLIRQESNSDNSIPPFCKGVINMEPFQIPVVTPSGNSFEKASLEEHCRISGCFDPVTREKFQNLEKLYPNKHLEKLLFQMYLKRPWLFDQEKNFLDDSRMWKFVKLS